MKYIKAINGIITPLVTPLTGNLEPDIDALYRLTDHVINGGVNGIFLPGTNGECASLTFEIRKELITSAMKAIKGRVPVFVNVGTSSYLESLKLIEFSADIGADYVVLAPPYYFSMNQKELTCYVKMLADRSSIPLFLYNAPQYFKTEIEPGTITELANHEKIVGIKDSSGNMNYFRQILNGRQSNEFAVFVGPEILLGECVLLGCNGGVNGGSNMFPKLYVNMYKAAIRKDKEAMKEWQALITKVNQNVYLITDSPMNTIIGLKYILSIKGICSEQMAMPVYSPLTDRQKRIMQELVTEFNEYGL